MSVVTRSPVWFYMHDEDSRDEWNKTFRRAAAIDRILTKPEWSWITGVLVNLVRDHPGFLAAGSWYRKGLIGRGRADGKRRNAAVYDAVNEGDCLDDFCSFWRVIERLAYSYADKSAWSDDEKLNAPVQKHIDQLAAEFFNNRPVPEILSDPAVVKKIEKLCDDLSHGNAPITLEVIDEATSRLKPLEDAAFSFLQRIPEFKRFARRSVDNDRSPNEATQTTARPVWGDGTPDTRAVDRDR